MVSTEARRASNEVVMEARIPGMMGLTDHKVFEDPPLKPSVSVGVDDPHSVSGKSAINSQLSSCCCLRGNLMPRSLALSHEWLYHSLVGGVLMLSMASVEAQVRYPLEHWAVGLVFIGGDYWRRT